jgi:SAM-dependent methyltransferase
MGHYFHQDLWAARKIRERSPSEHFDVGSRIDGFVAHVLTFMPVTVIDIRPMSEPIEGLGFIQADATDLSSIADASLESVSSLHAVEHFGLGRYGDTVDPTGASRAMAALSRVLKPGGRLYFSVPIGRERLCFNAQRIFSPDTVLRAFSDLELVSFAAVDDAGHLVVGSAPEDFREANYSCGLFEYTKV